MSSLWADNTFRSWFVTITTNVKLQNTCYSQRNKGDADRRTGVSCWSQFPDSLKTSTEERRWRKKPSKLRTISPSFFFILIYALLCPYFVPFFTVLFPALVPSLIPLFPFLFSFLLCFLGLFHSLCSPISYLFFFFFLPLMLTSFFLTFHPCFSSLPFPPPFISFLSLFLFTHSLTLKGDRSCVSPVTAPGAEILFV